MHEYRHYDCCDRITSHSSAETLLNVGLISRAALTNRGLRYKEDREPISLQQLIADRQAAQSHDCNVCEQCRSENVPHFVDTFMTEWCDMEDNVKQIFAVVLERNSLDGKKVKRKVRIPTKWHLKNNTTYRLYGVVSHLGD